MPKINGVGYSEEATPKKQKAFEKIITQHLSVVNLIYKKNPCWKKPYLYIDATAGIGKYEGLLGSPLIFHKIFNQLNINMTANCFFIEKEETSLTELKNNFSKLNCNTMNISFILGEYEKKIYEILEKINSYYGLLYIDPNGIVNMDFIKELSENEKMTGIDILLNFNATGLKRRNRAFNINEDAIDFICSINKNNWQIKRPMGKHQWTLLYGSNYKGLKLLKKLGFYDINSTEGEYILHKISYTKEEYRFNLPNQPKLEDFIGGK